MASMSGGYIHSFSPPEQRRLIHQAEYLAPWVHRGIDYSGRRHVLEVGCGVGAQLKILARRFPGTRFTGIDHSPEQIGHVRVLLAPEIASGRVTLAVGSAYDLPHARESFDGAFFCWFFEHLADPAAAMREALRVLAPDAILHATEVFNSGVHADPPRPSMMEYWTAFNELQGEFGGHPDIGIRLAKLARDAGLEQVLLSEISPRINNSLGMRERADMAAYFREIFTSGAGELVARKRVTVELVERMRADFDLIAADTASVMVYTAYQLRAVKPRERSKSASFTSAGVPE